MTSEEQYIISSLKKDDRTAMEAVFKQYHARLCHVAYFIVKDEDEAKDVVQEVFIKLWKNRHDLDIQLSLGAYLKRAVVNTAINYTEKQKRFNSVEIENTQISNSGVNETEQQQHSAELALAIDSAILRLPARTKAVYQLIRGEEMSYKEVAEALSISVKAVEKEMMKALRLLREALKDYLPSVILVFYQLYNNIF